MYQITKLYQQYLNLVHHLQGIKRSVFAFFFCLPTSLLALLLLLLLVSNGLSVFSVNLPFPAKSPPEPANFVTGESIGETPVTKRSTKISSLLMYAVKEENPPAILKTQLPPLVKSSFSKVPRNSSTWFLRSKRGRKKRVMSQIVSFGDKQRQFQRRITEFFKDSSCKVRFFMTWISSLDSFGDRELFSLESLFKSHPDACLVVVSNSMDSQKGNRIISPFWDKAFKLIAIKPDFDYIFKDTPAEFWFNLLKKGNVDPGEVSLGQNLSNLLRLALLYKYGGIYIDTDVIVLRSLAELRNSIGAQTINLETGKWSRLNNAVLIFDKQHPLLFKFIEEFAFTFDGNKWGHNGPYLASRVVKRIEGRPGFNFTVLPPSAFYPVNWSRIRSLFRCPRDEVHSKWLHSKLDQIRKQSFTVHLWNKQSRKIKVENGSIISEIMLDCCVFCNSSYFKSVSIQ
ncbi:putative Alpha 1 4-glycosyltransferase family protein [Tripterygium wilfordii]|uniref:Putative Alpha 1 4-glycosyltransferase family protein n=1 Tax=Tripterygium wilfordii TaxID=458696 RepID=A0A7J7D7H2_TRIWF|nr:uncharacterized protein At4g19900-like [Tripterygium wilfordii]KAF5742264.1 putative Alpha 1 4-glycosyltransferase family protein [Tripterygium wilfordii]